jgi:hypothetical protein
MSKYFNDPKVCSKSTYGLMLSASKVSPTPGTISADYLQTMQYKYPELVALSANHTLPLKKAEISYFTTLSFSSNLILKSIHSHTMARYINSRFYDTTSYLLHAKRFFPLEEATTALANFRIGTSLPLTTLASVQRHNTLQIQD